MTDVRLLASDEESVLGSMLTIADAIPRVLKAGIRSHSYRLQIHQQLHNAIVDCYIDRQGPIDAVDLGRHLVINNQLQEYCGAELLAGILEKSEPTLLRFTRVLDRYSHQ